MLLSELNFVKHSIFSDNQTSIQTQC